MQKNTEDVGSNGTKTPDTINDTETEIKDENSEGAINPKKVV